MKTLDNLKQDHLAIERVLYRFDEAGNCVRSQFGAGSADKANGQPHALPSCTIRSSSQRPS